MRRDDTELEAMRAAHHVDALLFGSGRPPSDGAPPPTAAPGDDVPRNPLRIALHGQNAPLCAQYVHHLVHALPHPVTQHPGSAAFRGAMREFWQQQPVYLEATRSDVAHGVMFLARNDLLPRWVFVPEGGGMR